jgi:hypothetical protein
MKTLLKLIIHIIWGVISKLIIIALVVIISLFVLWLLLENQFTNITDIINGYLN